MKRLGILLLLCFGLSACTQEDTALRDVLIHGTGIWGSRSGGSTLFSYDENTCQYSYSRDAVVFQLFDDNMGNWLIFDCGGTVLTPGAAFSANLEWTTNANILKLTNLPFKLLNIENGVYYFWCGRENIALRLRAD